MLLRILAVLALLAAAPARAQEWTDTRVGNYDFVCETSAGVFVSGHQRFSIAARACAAAAKANPTITYQVRPATYRLALITPATPATPTPPGPQSPTFALELDPTCAAIPVLQVSIGTAYASPPLATCYTGTEAATARFDLIDASGAPAPHGWAIDASSGVVSNPAAGPQGSGALFVRRTTASGIVLAFTRNWSIQ